MNRKRSAALVAGAAAALLAAAGTGSAETLLGKNYIGGSFGITQFGDDYMDTVFGTGKGVNGFGNINLLPNLDLNLGLGYMWADGDDSGIDLSLDSLAGGAGLTYSFVPQQRCNPYLRAGIQVINAEAEAAVMGLKYSEDDTEVGFNLGGGLEFEATREVLLRGGLDYYNIDDEDGVNLSGSIGYWFNPWLLGAVGASYDLDSEDTSEGISLIFRL